MLPQKMMDVLEILLGQGIVGNEGDLEVGAYQLPPEVVLAAVGADAFPHKVGLVDHDLPWEEFGLKFPDCQLRTFLQVSLYRGEIGLERRLQRLHRKHGSDQLAEELL